MTSTHTAHGLLPAVARFSVRRRRLVIALWVITTVAAAPLALTLTSALSGAGWEAQGSTAQEVRDELRRDFPQAGAEAAMVVVVQNTAIPESPDAVKMLAAGLMTAPGSAGAIDPDTSMSSTMLRPSTSRGAVVFARAPISTSLCDGAPPSLRPDPYRTVLPSSRT